MMDASINVSGRQLDDEKIRVLMTSTSYPANLEDWRGLFIRHLADALGRRDDLRVSLWAPPGDVHASVARVATPAEDEWFSSLIREGGIAHLLRKRRIRGLGRSFALIRNLRNAMLRVECDVYHLNWLQSALALPRNSRPALVTVLGTDMHLLRLPLMRAIVRTRLRGRKVVICPNAEWMTPELERSFGDCARIQAVPFGIDPRWYSLRRSLDRSAPARWLVVSRLTRDKIGPLFEWCAPMFADGSRELHLFGPMQESISVPAWVHYHGPATPDQLHDWFQEARGLITLSRHSEGRPQVMLEGMAAGLPIVALRTPAHENILRHTVTGWLVETQAELQSALDTLDNPQENARIGDAARWHIEAEVGTWDDCARRYTTLYKQLLPAAAT